jgi:uncharacterized protein YbbC (DUF1343 family)
MRIRHQKGTLKSAVFNGALAFFMIINFIAGAACKSQKTETRAPAAAAVRPTKVKLGVEVFFEKYLAMVKGKKVGLITNPSGVDSRLRSTIDLFRTSPDVKLVALYGPEHGVRGTAQAGEYVPFYMDDKFKIPVFSLYGPSLKPQPGMLKNIDEFMRSFDTTHAGKKLDLSMTKDVDVLVYDIQDVGTRVYTFESTMAYAMQVSAEAGIDFIVLDRPDPISGVVTEGPILEYPEYSSFVGVYPVPVRFGMTVGELAKLYNDKFLEKKAKLTVVPMEGWRREMWYDETGLRWIFPSPNMPTLDTAAVYPGQVFFEGTNVSEGRGTTRPFEIFGAAWIDGFELTKKLNALGLVGVTFREQWFTPTFSKFKGELCGGAQIHVTDRAAFRPLETTLQIIKTIRDMYPDKFEFHEKYFDKIMGTSKVRLALEKGASVKNIVAGFAPGLAQFAEARKPYLLY